MVYKYKTRDSFWDIESLENLFTVAFYYPKNNYMILSYIDDDGIIDPNNIQQIKALAHKRNADFDGDVYLENLNQIGSAEQGIPGLQTFIKRVGYAKNGYTKTGQRNNQVLNGSKDQRDVYKANGRLEVPAIYYPVKDTDPEYDADQHGYFFGYNTTQYDLTMLAHFVTSLSYVLDPEADPYRKLISKDRAGEGEIPTAADLRRFNDQLFESEFKSNMASRLAYEYYDPDVPLHYQKPDYQTDAWLARKGWLYTGRFIDVASLNEKMYRVGLKRLLGMLGHQILEFEGLSDGNAIKDPNVVNELIAYNISDVINLRWLFEHKVYQNNFVLKLNLLKSYPETIYMRDTPSDSEKAQAFASGATLVEAPYRARIHYRNVERTRLTIDSTSAKFVEKVIAPYNKMTDKKVVDFTYPAPAVAEKLSKERGYKIEPTDVLEDTKTWFEENVARPGTQAHDEFMEIYHFYDGIRGRNFNVSDKYKEDYIVKGEPTIDPMRDSKYTVSLIKNNELDFTPKDNDYVKELMQKYNTNLFYFTPEGERTTCLVNFSIGGIHGAEIDMTAYKEDLYEWRKKNEALQFIQEQFDYDALAAINGETYVKDIDGNDVKIRTFLKSTSTKKQAEWRIYPEPELFKKKNGILKVNGKYTYVSVGASQHEDFTSYYPLLLTRLEVFKNPERGANVDPYYGLFEQRYAKKKEARNMMLSESVRQLADLVQDAMKLLLNSATGAADATFDNNIRMNNAIISMRIIGQLFAWRIGQAQTLVGARVPSTNTDGLYTMDLDAETNEKVLNEVAEAMYIGIEPEPLDRFVTKDSNNRLEIERGEIGSAKGGTLNSWGGPEPTQSLDHPAAVDRALAYYLKDHPNPANTPFDYELGRQSFAKIVQEYSDKPVEILRFFQWILSSSPGTNQYIFLQEKNVDTGEIYTNIPVQHYNRIFLIKQTESRITTPMTAVKRKLNPATARKREKDGDVIVQHDPVGKLILEENGFNWAKDADRRDEAKVFKVKNMPTDQNVFLYNNDLHQLTAQDVQNLLNKLDINAYISLLQKTFENSWSNVA